jgi:hypothetical protein
MWLWNKWKRRKIDFVEGVISKLDCDYSIIKVSNSSVVMDHYRSALREGKQNGYLPVVIIPSDRMVEIIDREMVQDFPSDDRETIIAKAKELEVTELLERMLVDVMPEEEDEDDNDIIGEFILGDQTDHFLSVEELTNEEIIIAKIPTNRPWEAAAWFPMGGFNECPMPEEQVAVFKYWYEKYRAYPALVTADVWEFYVEQPPSNKEEAEALAWEQFGFCSDIVYQGIGSVKGLAGTLINSPVWYFWWD